MEGVELEMEDRCLSSIGPEHHQQRRSIAVFLKLDKVNQFEISQNW